MFKNGSATYKTDIKMSEVYEDKYSGFKGTATGVFFYENGCVRVMLEGGKDGELKAESFDDVRLVHVETQRPIVAPPAQRGGPREAPARRQAGRSSN